MEAKTRLARVSRVALRYVAWAAFGVAFSVVVAVWLSPRWVDICSPMNYRRAPCEPIETMSMVGYVSSGLGLVLMTLGPVGTTLWKLFRHGYNWETSHVEPAHVNLPIVFGIAHFIGGMLLVSAV